MGLLAALGRSKTARAWAIAALLVAVVNAWVGWRLPHLIPESSIDNAVELERRVALYPHKDRVKLLVFGSSHALFGLRPPSVARALGLRPDEVFSLALPSGSAVEMRWLAEHDAPLFPAARRAVCVVDEIFLSEPGEYRWRYLTRYSPLDRLAYAASLEGLDRQLGMALGWLFPLGDFASVIQSAALEHPGLFLRRLFRDEPLPGSNPERLRAIDHPWGTPPLMDVDRAALARPSHLKTTARYILRKMAFAPHGLAELDRMVGGLEARGVQVSLVHLPYTEAMERMLVAQGPLHALYRDNLARYLAASGRRLLPTPPRPPAAEYLDYDHLSPAGAARMAAWLAEALPAVP